MARVLHTVAGARRCFATRPNLKSNAPIAAGVGGTVAELGEERDDAEIRLMRALDEIPLPR